MKQFILFSGVLLLAACEMISPAPVEENETLDGPLEGLTPEQAAQFNRGDVAFSENFTSKTGLGPIFVASSCVGCHTSDGKGHPFTTLTRFGQSDTLGNMFLDQGGPQLQNRAIPGNTSEVVPTGASSSGFLPPSVTGLGYLAALTDVQILANADPSDSDNDGISGRPNYLIPPDYFVPGIIHQPKNGKYIGRFGKKAAAITLLIQSVNAYNEDMGITTDFRVLDPVNYAVSNQPTDNVPDPEIPTSVVNNVVFYLRTLKAPIRRDEDHPEVIAGESLFEQIGCISCHIAEWETPSSDIEVLSNKQFYPFTDLLLHDMGEELNDNYTEGTALVEEWRTPPLWGLGLSKESQGGRYFLMHDGRAFSIEEAILFHGGEAETSRNNYNDLSDIEKANILKFLESL